MAPNLNRTYCIHLIFVDSLWTLSILAFILTKCIHCKFKVFRVLRSRTLLICLKGFVFFFLAFWQETQILPGEFCFKVFEKSLFQQNLWLIVQGLEKLLPKYFFILEEFSSADFLTFVDFGNSVSISYWLGSLYFARRSRSFLLWRDILLLKIFGLEDMEVSILLVLLLLLARVYFPTCCLWISSFFYMYFLSNSLKSSFGLSFINRSWNFFCWFSALLVVFFSRDPPNNLGGE